MLRRQPPLSVWYLRTTTSPRQTDTGWSTATYHSGQPLNRSADFKFEFDIPRSGVLKSHPRAIYCQHGNRGLQIHIVGNSIWLIMGVGRHDHATRFGQVERLKRVTCASRTFNLIRDTSNGQTGQRANQAHMSCAHPHHLTHLPLLPNGNLRRLYSFSIDK